MANLSQIKREKMLAFLEALKEQHDDDESLMAINQIERELTSKKYGLVWEEHEEEVDVKMQTHIPVFTEVTQEACLKAMAVRETCLKIINVTAQMSNNLWA